MSGMGKCAAGMKYGVVEGVKKNTLRPVWFGHFKRMSETKGLNIYICWGEMKNN